MMRLYVLKPARNHYTMSHMDNNSDEGILNAHLATRVIEQSNATDAAIF